MPTSFEQKLMQNDLEREIEELKRENVFLENRIIDVIETKSQELTTKMKSYKTYSLFTSPREWLNFKKVAKRPKDA